MESQMEATEAAIDLERWDWPWAKDDATTAKTDPRVSFMGKMRSYFGLETQKEAEQIAFLEAKKVGYTFPHYSESDRECFLAVKPGYLEQCRNAAHGSIGDVRKGESGECETSADCVCDRFNVPGIGGGTDKRYKEVGMPCTDEVVQFLTVMDRDAAVGNFLDPKRYSWETRCYMPKTTSWLWGDKDDRSKSKCMCVLVDNTLTAEATQDAETQMCSYTPMEVDEAAVSSRLDGAEEADKYTKSGHMGG